MFKHISGWSGKYKSRLEEKVYDEFHSWKLIPEWNYGVDSFDIDFAFPDIKLAIEIDGAKFHGVDREKRDIWRQKLLEKKGWTFERFDGWFAYRYTNVLVVKILLKYFIKRLKPKIKNRAGVALGIYFREIDPKLSQKLLNLS